MFWCPRKPEEGIGSTGGGVTGGFELPNVGAGNQTPGFCKNSKYSYVPSRLSSPPTEV